VGRGEGQLRRRFVETTSLLGLPVGWLVVFFLAPIAIVGLYSVNVESLSPGAHFTLTTQTQPAEELPLAYLPRLSRMKPGEVAVFGRTAIQLIHAEDAPLPPEQAYPLIEQFLAGKKRMELAAAEVKKLREGARIEYVAQVKSNSRTSPVTR